MSPRAKLTSASPEIIRLYTVEHQTLQAIADQYGVTLQAIAYQLEQAGISRRKPDGRVFRLPEVRAKANAHRAKGAAHHSFRDLPIEVIKAAYESGSGTIELGQRYGVNATTIGKKLRAAGTQLRKPGFNQPYEHINSNVLRMTYEAGVSVRILAHSYGVSATVITNRLHALDIPMRKGFPRYSRSNDGHMVQSGWERCVDDWLAEQHISHECHPTLPFGVERLLRADFKVKDWFIEVWGMTDALQYCQRRNAKMELYRQHNLPLIEIWPINILNNDYSMLAHLVP